MEIVKAFKTEDGQVHGTEQAALQHQHQLDLRGFFNRNLGRDMVSLSELIRSIKTNNKELLDILSTHNRKMERLAKRNSVKEFVAAL